MSTHIYQIVHNVIGMLNNNWFMSLYLLLTQQGLHDTHKIARCPRFIPGQDRCRYGCWLVTTVRYCIEIIQSGSQLDSKCLNWAYAFVIQLVISTMYYLWINTRETIFFFILRAILICNHYRSYQTQILSWVNNSNPPPLDTVGRILFWVSIIQSYNS